MHSFIKLLINALQNRSKPGKSKRINSQSCSILGRLWKGFLKRETDLTNEEIQSTSETVFKKPWKHYLLHWKALSHPTFMSRSGHVPELLQIHKGLGKFQNQALEASHNVARTMDELRIARGGHPNDASSCLE